MDYFYKKAEDFLPWTLQDKILNANLFPYWTNEFLYYFKEIKSNKILIKVSISSGEKEEIIKFNEFINNFSQYLMQEIDWSDLPLNIFSIQENPLLLIFTYKDIQWQYDVEKNNFESIKIYSAHLESPNKNWSCWIKNHNIFLTDIKSHHDYQLTIDGENLYDYASSPETNTRAVTQRFLVTPLPPVATWSPDSKKIITHKLDQRRVRELHLLENAPNGSQRPKIHSYRMSFSGDEHLPLAELLVIDIENKEITPLKTEPLLSPYLTPLEFKWVWWSENSQNIYFLREARGSKELSLCVADSKTGITKTLITEKAETYVEPSQLFLWPHQIIVLEETQQIIWMSEQSGYSHLYLYKMGNHFPESAITQGEWCVKELYFYDPKANWLYFTVSGYNKEIDPYYKQLFRCHLDGSELECLTKENAYHIISISPERTCFLDTFSTIDTAPISVLKRMDGQLICHLETADIQGLSHLNWKPPRRVSLKGRDDITAIYGNLYFPSYFDSNKKYPLIDHIYPGPQIYRTSSYFSLYGAIFRSVWTAQALAELGFIVLHIDGFGTPGRSKAFHHATYQNMADCGIADHVTAIKELADQYSFIDLERIGITGYSGGGFAAARAMLMYPEFFKVGVAAAGNHDLRCYPASYGEKYNSLDITTYPDQSNAAHAEKLQGKLFLIHGELDDNVHPCATMQLIDALIKYNKDFDMLIMPNQNHKSTFDHPYYMKKHWDYFIEHLLEKTPPKGYFIKPMPESFPQIMDW
jgi:dipeptidyl-peptidase-4